VNKFRKLPREGATGRDDVDDDARVETDVEGHGASAVLRLPGTGGDAFPRRPSSGGELTDEDDVEGYRLR
jgi:hypothetical protein